MTTNKSRFAELMEEYNAQETYEIDTIHEIIEEVDRMTGWEHEFAQQWKECDPDDAEALLDEIIEAGQKADAE